MKRECESCIKRKTTYCPTSIECMATDDMPYYQNRIMLLEENQQLKEKTEKLEKAIKEAIKYLYEHSQYVDEYGIHYIKENEYCVDYLLDILDIDKGE